MSITSRAFLRLASLPSQRRPRRRPDVTNRRRVWSNGSRKGIAMEHTVMNEATVRSLMSKGLAGDPAKELLMIAVEYPPGSVDPVHTHHAQALVYVLEGSIVMQVR